MLNTNTNYLMEAREYLEVRAMFSGSFEICREVVYKRLVLDAEIVANVITTTKYSILKRNSTVRGVQ